jgi:two-component system sensor histidine kinase DegS
LPDLPPLNDEGDDGSWQRESSADSKGFPSITRRIPVPGNIPATFGRSFTDGVRGTYPIPALHDMTSRADSPPPGATGGSRTASAGEGTGGNAATSDPWDEQGDLLPLCADELERITRELGELRPLIEQFRRELEQSNHKKVLAAARIREMETHLEMLSRQEIRAAYTEASTTEMQAFMLSEQLDRLTSKQEIYDRYAGYLRRTIADLEARGPVTPSPPRFPQRFGPPTSAMPALPANMRDESTTRNGLYTGQMRAVGPTRQTAQSVIPAILQAQDAVRQRVAERLHEGPAQALANVTLSAEVASGLITANPAQASAEMQRLRSVVSWTMQETRRLLFQLRPVPISDLGLIGALQRYGRDIEVHYQIPIIMSAPETELPLREDVKTQIFRVAQEAILNAAQHAHATQVIVSIAREPAELLILVDDDGEGFEIESALVRARQGHTVGLANMQQRAELLGGWLKIESSRGHGTHIELSMPM